MTKGKIAFYGAAGETSGARCLLTCGKDRILLDCGQFYGENSKLRNAQKFEFDPKSINAVAISHSHWDHCGSLPLLLKSGYASSIYCTSRTAWKMHFLDDYSRLLKRINKPRINKQFPLLKDIAMGFYDAGHTPGSAMIFLEMPIGNLLYTGDLGPSKSWKGSSFTGWVDYLVVDSSNGEDFRGKRYSYDEHASSEDVLSFIVHLPIRPKKIFLIHGSAGACGALTKKLKNAGYENVVAPKFGTEYALD